MRIIKVVLLVKYLQKYIVLKGPSQNGAHFWVSQKESKTCPSRKSFFITQITRAYLEPKKHSGYKF